MGGVGRLGTVGSPPNHASGGGGGAGSVGGDFSNTTGGGNGGTGKEFITYFGNGVGQSGWFAGGGGGNTYEAAGTVGYGNGGNGLLGGGGNGGFDGGTQISATAGAAGTGGGGGGSKYDGTGSNGGAGGTGVVIIRYRIEPSTSSSLELVRGTTTDGAVDYSVGNYDGSFKIKSVNAGTPTDRMTISSAGNVDIAGSVNIPTGSTYKINGVDLSILTTTDINNTSNYVSRINTELTTAIGTKQVTIINTAGQLIIGNGNGATTTNAGLTWTSATNMLNATNLTISGTSTLTGNVGIGTTALTNILQVGSGGRLRIANGTTDYTTIGTQDADGATNTSIVISGNTRSTNAGNIQYLATASAGSHIFYTSPTTTTRMTISSSGVNVNNSLGVGERVGIATSPHATYQLDIQGTQPRLRLFDPATNGNSVIMFRELSDLYGMDICYIGNTDKKMYITTFNNSSTPVVRVAIDRINGNVGIGTNDTSTYNLNVVGDINISSGSVYRINGTVIANSWLAGTPANSIYYSAGNVGIGTATIQTSYKLQVQGNSYVANTLVFNDNYRDAGASYACNKIALYGGGNTPTTTSQYGFGVAGSTLEYFTNGNHKWYYGTTGGTSYGTVGMTLTNNNLDVAGSINCNWITSSQYVLGTSCISRNAGFESKIFCDTAGMYYECCNSGSTTADYIKMGAYNGNTNFWSISNRNIIMRLYTGALGGAYYGWEFLNTGTSYNAANTTTWNTISDHRIKEDIKKANLQTCYDNVKNINLYRFNFLDGFKEGTKHDRTQLGYIAQQVSQHFPKSVIRSKIRLDDKREIPDLASVDVSQVNFTLFGAVKQLIRVVEKQSKRIKKLEEMMGIIDDDEVENDADEPYVKIECDEVDIDTIEPSEPEGV